MAGYSSRPLAAKLGLKPGMAAFCIDAPADYPALLGPDAAPVAAVDDIPDGAEFTHLFTTSRAGLQAHLTRARAVMARDGMVWVSWPKRASKRPTEVTEDVIRDLCLPMGLVDVKVCAVNGVWSGLKLVIRKELR